MRYDNELNTDVSVFRIDYQGSDYAANAQVIQGHNGYPRIVPVKDMVDGHAEGLWRWHTGKADNHDAISPSGQIEDESVRLCYGPNDDPCINDLVMVNCTGEGSSGGHGDSGGPVFKALDYGGNNLVHAAGIYSGQACYDYTSGDDCPGTDPEQPDWWSYTPIAHALNADYLDWDMRYTWVDACPWSGQGACPDDQSGDY
jgi:hypothetical protein